MLLHYEDANEVCIRSAKNIAQVSSELGTKLENLGTVMTLYSRKTFSKESFQWTKCVVKYLYDTYAYMGTVWLTRPKNVYINNEENECYFFLW